MKKFSPLFLFILLFTSCSSIEQISIDYMIPAEINFPESLSRVAVVNNVSNQGVNNKSFEEQTKLDESSPKLFNFNGDANIMVESLAQSLATANYFDEVVVCDSSLRLNDKFGRQTLLSQSETKMLAEQLDVDFIIAIDSLPLQASRYIDYHPEWNTFIGLVDMKGVAKLNTALNSSKLNTLPNIFTFLIFHSSVGFSYVLNKSVDSTNHELV